MTTTKTGRFPQKRIREFTADEYMENITGGSIVESTKEEDGNVNWVWTGVAEESRQEEEHGQFLLREASP